MKDSFPVTHSILSAKALITDLLPHYDIEPPTDCRFLQPGLNDTFFAIFGFWAYIPVMGMIGDLAG